MKCVKITPSGLKGRITVPPSKSISHRMLICASLAAGDSIISNIDFSDDILATLKGIKALGAKVSYVKANSNLETYDVIIKGKGYPEIVQQTVDCFE